jgi:hypothetical protein
MRIKYLSGHDVCEPICKGRKIIGHCTNDLGIMSSGVAAALFKKWSDVRSKYIAWHKMNNDLGNKFELGKTQFVKVEDDIVVANIIGQHGVGRQNGNVPVRYDALREGCAYIRKACKFFSASAHFPYLMGCDLAGGNWEEVEKIIQEELIDHDVEVTVYDLFNKRG